MKTLRPATRQLLLEHVERNLPKNFKRKNGLFVPQIAGGAVTASGLFYTTWSAGLTNSIVLNLDAETHKCALFNNSITPNFSTDTSYAVAPYNANEVSGTGWSAGGVVLTSTVVSESPTGTLKWTAGNVSQPTTTLTNARCALIHADGLSPKRAIVLVNFGSDFSTVAGTFAINWNAAGIATIDLTP